jgi:hypothetical protein
VKRHDVGVTTIAITREKPSIMLTLTPHRVDVSSTNAITVIIFRRHDQELRDSMAKWNKGRNYFISFEKLFWRICKVRMSTPKIAATYRIACIFVA